MIARYLSSELAERVNDMPVVAVLGPRQVGKTTLVKNFATQTAKKVIYLDIESPQDRNRLQDPELYFSERQNDLIVLDEIQRFPELFPILRAAIDRHRIPGRFILSGSASPELIQKSSESLAGRISYLELQPLHWGEVSATLSYQQHWLRGGFPDMLLAPSDESANRRLHDFITTYVERDLPLMGLSAAPATLRNLLSMLVGSHSGLLNTSNLSRSLGLNVQTVNRYLDFLENAFLIRRLQPWHININKRIVKTPKIFVRDSGILHALAGLTDAEALAGSMWLGNSWEGYVIQQIIAQLRFDVRPYFYRTADGSELDLVLVRGVTPVIGIEIKYSNAPKLSKGNLIAASDLGNVPILVVTPSADDYPLSEKARVCSMKTLKENLQAFLVEG